MAIETVYNDIYERRPIITNSAHCARAISLATGSDIYFGIGRTSPWEKENDEGFVPPEPDINAENLDELVGMKKADRVTLVEPHTEGEIDYAGMRFRTLTTEEAMQHKARWVLIETTIYFKELPPVSYRQTGVFSHVKPKEGIENTSVLLAKDIEDVGILEVINNRKVVTRQSDTKDTYFMIVEC